MKPFVKYFLIFLSAFAATAAGTYIAVMLVASDSREVVLPDLKGKNIIYVLNSLTALNLNPKLHGSEYSKTYPRYHVISQDPEPGTIIKMGRDVILYISKGRKKIKVPDLRYMTINDAEISMGKNEFQKGSVSRAYSSDLSKDMIIAQYPPPYTLQDHGSKIDLLVSKGIKLPKYAMPDLYSIDLKKAKNLINERKLDISTMESDYKMTLPGNVIIGQSPAPGAIVTKETKISLIVNQKGPGMFADSDITGNTTVISCFIKHGFLKKHVIITADLFGYEIDLVDRYLRGPGYIYALIPGSVNTLVKIFVDDKLVKTQTINPWNTGITEEN